ncbi:MAG TPA: NAD-dependent deacylase [Longimicrobiales bacterium]|nr:NAD-dependent deacylase [Longimicrobiales bacterium]
MALEELERAAGLLSTARHIVALTGAGISKDSGLPTFREAQTGLWARYRPEDLATPEAFARQPDVVWRWYAWRRSLVEAAVPNAGHVALAAMQRAAAAFTLVTQNVDGLHRRAGSTDAIELHGDITRIRCSACGLVHRRHGPGEPPRCDACGGHLRPDVVWFGEMLPEDALRRATAAAVGCDVLLSVGTSGVVYPAAGLVGIAARSGAVIIVVNPEPDAGVPDAIHLRGSASDVLPGLVAMAWPGHRARS